MSNFFSTQLGKFDYQDGTSISYSARVDQGKLASLVYRAGKNKSGKATMGPITVQVKRPGSDG